jgi:hypothetical protein
MILKKAKSTFLPGFPILPNEQYDFDNFRTFSSWQIPKLDWKRHELQDPGGCQCGAVWQKSYPTVRLGTPAKLKYLHSKIGRRVDLARVRYGTMQSE